MGEFFGRYTFIIITRQPKSLILIRSKIQPFIKQVCSANHNFEEQVQPYYSISIAQALSGSFIHFITFYDVSHRYRFLVPPAQRALLLWPTINYMLLIRTWLTIMITNRYQGNESLLRNLVQTKLQLKRMQRARGLSPFRLRSRARLRFTS